MISSLVYPWTTLSMLAMLEQQQESAQKTPKRLRHAKPIAESTPLSTQLENT
jgi:hypothetical protein